MGAAPFAEPWIVFVCMGGAQFRLYNVVTHRWRTFACGAPCQDIGVAAPLAAGSHWLEIDEAAYCDPRYTSCDHAPVYVSFPTREWAVFSRGRAASGPRLAIAVAHDMHTAIAAAAVWVAEPHWAFRGRADRCTGLPGEMWHALASHVGRRELLGRQRSHGPHRLERRERFRSEPEPVFRGLPARAGAIHVLPAQRTACVRCGARLRRALRLGWQREPRVVSGAARCSAEGPPSVTASRAWARAHATESG
jgi:hypothetical protein